MNNECRERLLKIIPLLGSDNEGEVIATVQAMKRVLLLHKLNFSDLAESIQAKDLPETVTVVWGNSMDNFGFDSEMMNDLIRRAYEAKNNPDPPPAREPSPQKSPDKLTYDEVTKLCEDFRMIQSNLPESAFIDRIYMDISILGNNHYISDHEMKNLLAIKKRYSL